jgi:hypothetical protein
MEPLDKIKRTVKNNPKYKLTEKNGEYRMACFPFSISPHMIDFIKCHVNFIERDNYSVTFTIKESSKT